MTSENPPPQKIARCPGCRQKRPIGFHCPSCGEYLPTGATFGLNPSAAVNGLLTAFLAAVGCSRFLRSDTLTDAMADAGVESIPWQMEPAIAGGGAGWMVYAIITAAQRFRRGDRAAVVDFAIAAVIANAAILIATGTAPGWSYDHITLIPATGWLMPPCVYLVRHCRRKLVG